MASFAQLTTELVSIHVGGGDQYSAGFLGIMKNPCSFFNHQHPQKLGIVVIPSISDKMQYPVVVL